MKFRVALCLAALLATSCATRYVGDFVLSSSSGPLPSATDLEPSLDELLHTFGFERYRFKKELPEDARVWFRRGHDIEPKYASLDGADARIVLSLDEGPRLTLNDSSSVDETEFTRALKRQIATMLKTKFGVTTAFRRVNTSWPVPNS